MRQFEMHPFQGANKFDFSDAVELFTIPDTIQMKMHRATVFRTGRYRYVRYLFPPNTYGSLGEIAFYSNKQTQKPLVGKPLKSQQVDSTDLHLAFDGKLDKFIHTPVKGSYNEQWVGLGLGRKRQINAVGYSPRNDRNNIMAGMDYELLYWDNGWKSLGHKITKSDSELVYGNVPKGALLWLRNHTEEKRKEFFCMKMGSRCGGEG